MDDRPGRRPLPDAEIPLHRLNFRSAADDIRGRSKPRRQPHINYQGYFRRALGDGPGNLGDALNEYEAWVANGNGGADVMSEFMNLQGAQQNIVLADFTSGQQGLANLEAQYFAASNGYTPAGSADAAAIAVANEVLPQILGDFWAKGSQAEWQSLTPAQQAQIAQTVLASQKSNGVFTIDKDTLGQAIDAAATANKSNTSLLEIAGIIVGAIVVVGGVVIIVSRI